MINNNVLQRFRVFVPQAEQVFLSGDFNNWSTVAVPMERDAGGAWEVVLPLPLGTHQFYFFVINRHWNISGHSRSRVVPGGLVRIDEPATSAAA